MKETHVFGLNWLKHDGLNQLKRDGLSQAM
jgi:hypothetical protein